MDQRPDSFISFIMVVLEKKIGTPALDRKF